MSYQAVYDAAFKQFDISCVTQQIQNAVSNIEIQLTRPCILLKPKIYIDGHKWCVLYGDNLQDGLAGFGNSPELAMLDFDKNFYMRRQ